MTQQVSIGFIGCGFMGQIAHLANFAQDPRCRIEAIADLRPDLAHKVANHYSIPQVYENHTDLLENSDIDAIVEITQDDQHVPIAIDAMKMGKHVYTEKPLSTNVKDAKRAAKASKKYGVKLQVSYMKRYDPGVELAKKHVSEALSDGSMGEITYVRSHGFGGDWVCNIEKPITTDEPPPRYEKVNPGWLPTSLVNEYRSFLNVFCHNINLVRHFVGNPNGARFCSFHTKGKILLMEYSDFPAIVETGWLSASFWDESTQIYFRDGRITIDTPPPLLRNATAEVDVYHAGEVQSSIRPLPRADWSFRRSAQHFIDCIVSDQEPRSSGEDSVEDIKLVEQAFRRIVGAKD